MLAAVGRECHSIPYIGIRVKQHDSGDSRTASHGANVECSKKYPSGDQNFHIISSGSSSRRCHNEMTRGHTEHGESTDNDVPQDSIASPFHLNDALRRFSLPFVLSTAYLMPC